MFVFMHRHGLHMAHIITANISFAIIAFYLYRSAHLASRYDISELKLNFPQYNANAEHDKAELKGGDIVQFDCVIDSGNVSADLSPLNGRAVPAALEAGGQLPRGAIILSGKAAVSGRTQRHYVADMLKPSEPLFNPCAAFLARSGIWVRSPRALKKTAGLKTIAPRGMGDSVRDGYEITQRTLAEMGITLKKAEETDTVHSPTIMLSDFDEADSIVYHNVNAPDILITHNKITHILKVVYAARILECAARIQYLLFAAALLAIGVLVFFEVYELMLMPVTIMVMLNLPLIRRVERKLLRRVTFRQIIDG